MATNNVTVHVYSFLPRLGKVLEKALPQITIKTVNWVEDYTNLAEKKPSDSEVAQLKDARILICDAHVLGKIYRNLPNLKWAQITFAGVESLTAIVRNSVEPSFPVTRCTSFGQQMAEYSIAWIINHERGFQIIPDMQKQQNWEKFAATISTNYRTLKDITVGVLGVGAIGRTIIECLKVFKCTVHGFGRSPSAPADLLLDAYWSGDGLKELLQECDYIINILPSTSATKNMLGEDVLKFTKKKPVLINVGRGDVIKEEDIIKALDHDWISAAVLDVFETEPLDQDSPLWLHPKVSITPHVAALTRVEGLVTNFKENLEKYLANEKLLYQIDWQRGY